MGDRGREITTRYRKNATLSQNTPSKEAEARTKKHVIRVDFNPI